MSDPQSCRWWVVTDLDGTLMDHHYDWSPAAATLRSLQRAGVPVIPCTSKTAEEVERFRAAAQLRHPDRHARAMLGAAAHRCRLIRYTY